MSVGFRYAWTNSKGQKCATPAGYGLFLQQQAIGHHQLRLAHDAMKMRGDLTAGSNAQSVDTTVAVFMQHIDQAKLVALLGVA